MASSKLLVSAPAETDVVAGFADRVARRDVPPEPEPLRLDADSIRQRLAAALHRLRPRLTTDRRATLAQLCYQFLTQPVLDSTAPAAAERTRGRDWQLLLALGLVERLHAGRQRRYRLSRAGEDWLLAVVQGDVATVGAAPPAPAAYL